MHLEKFQVDKIQIGRLSAIIHLDRPDIVEYHKKRSRYLHHYYKTNRRFQEKMHFEKIQLVQVQNGRQSAIIHFHMAVIWWTVLDG